MQRKHIVALKKIAIEYATTYFCLF